MKQPDKNVRVLFGLVAGAALMVAISYAAVPLYTLFCRATGFGGTTQRVAEAPLQSKNRMVTVSFDGNVDPALPWDFAPQTKSVRVKLGEVTNIKYIARNNGARTLTGTATFNVQPDKAGTYFDKIQCFCFTKQTIKAGATAELPVQFYVDPALDDDRNNDDIQTITLSYTFFPAKR